MVNVLEYISEVDERLHGQNLERVNKFGNKKYRSHHGWQIFRT